MEKNSSHKKDNTGLIIGVIFGSLMIAVALIIIIGGIVQNNLPDERYDPVYHRYCLPDGSGCATVEKPMIYLYPEEDTDVIVKLGEPEKITTSYPKYNNGWRVFAQKDGTLVDENTGRILYGLYWEGANFPAVQSEEGFVVKGSESAAFLEEKLAILGLNERESEEFIVYWLSKLEANNYNYIHFETNELLDEYMPINVSPKPDSVIRIAMSFKGLDEPIKVVEQELMTPVREGFTLVEWGGSEIK